MSYNPGFQFRIFKFNSLFEFFNKPHFKINTDGQNIIAIAGGLAIAAGLSYLMTKKDGPIDPLYDFNNQSIEIDVREDDFRNLKHF